LVPGYLSLTL